MRILKNHNGVSHVVGYMLSLSLTTIIVLASILTTNNMIDERISAAANIYAENLADRIADKIKNVCIMKQQYPDINYSTTMEIPDKLMNRYNYYVEITNNKVYVNASGADITANSDVFNVPDLLSTNLKGKIWGSNGVINLTCKRFDYVHKLDFGTADSEAEQGYTRVTDQLSTSNWPERYKEWNYKTPITITNPTAQASVGYQILIQLDDSNFDYSNANDNASDLRFIDSLGNELNNYWVERWNARDTSVSRIWVRLENLPAAGITITMYYGNKTASPLSNGENTFGFFDDFSGVTTPDTTKWKTYSPTNGEIYVNDEGLLVLTNGSAVTSIDGTTYTNYVVETKAKTIGTNTREASVFIRHDGTTSPFYQHASVFSSGNFSTGNNLTLMLYSGGVWVNKTSKENKPGVDQNWKRLTYILNGDDHIICRYYYENYSVEGAAGASDESYKANKHIGLCTIKPDTIAYFDWVLVRKYLAKTDLTIVSPEEAIPMAHVHETYCRDYKWLQNNYVKSVDPGTGNSFVCNDGINPGGTLKIMNLSTTEEYSLTFKLGDSRASYDNNYKVENMTITIYGYPKITDIDCDPYKNIWVTGIRPDSSGTLEIIFSDDDTGTKYYWVLDQMTIQKGERVIEMTGDV
jgi:hypothetical protein